MHVPTRATRNADKIAPPDTLASDGTEDSMIPAPLSERRKLGIYYTPSAAAALIAEWAIRAPKDLILEPSFGGCALLVAAIDRLKALGNDAPEQQLQGYDIDPSAFTHLQRLLGSNAPPSFFQQNFLAATLQPNSVDAVIANPPFIGYRKLSKQQRKEVTQWRTRNDVTLPADAGLWAYFLLHSLSSLKEAGRLAYLLPGTFESADYAKSFLFHLCKHFHAVRIFSPSERIFLTEGTAEKVIILLCEGYSNQPLEKASEAKIITQEFFSIPPRNSECGHDIQSTPDYLLEATALLAKIHTRGNAFTLGSRANPLIGEVVGDTSFFVKTANEWRALGIKNEYTVPLLRKIGDRHPTITVSTKHTAEFDFPQLLRPKKYESPRETRNYFDSYDEKKRIKNATFRKRRNWWQVSYETAAAAFIPSVSHRDVRLILNDAQISCSNSIYKIIPQKPDWRGLPEILASFSTLFQLSAEVLCRNLGGGALKLEPSDVKKLLLPTSVDIINKNQAAKLRYSIELALKKGEAATARSLADQFFLARLRNISKADLESLSRLLDALRKRRLNKAN